jgi:hypothetical protein
MRTAPAWFASAWQHTLSPAGAQLNHQSGRIILADADRCEFQKLAVAERQEPRVLRRSRLLVNVHLMDERAGR